MWPPAPDGPGKPLVIPTSGDINPLSDPLVERAPIDGDMSPPERLSTGEAIPPVVLDDGSIVALPEEMLTVDWLRRLVPASWAGWLTVGLQKPFTCSEMISPENNS